MNPINGVKFNAFFLINNAENKVTESALNHSTLQFTDLVKTCDIDIILAKKLPNIEQSKDFDLVFIDVDSFSFTDNIPSELQRLVHSTRVVLFNAADNIHNEKKLLISNIAGIFYRNDPLEMILRGITKLQKNERWFKRKTMNSALSELLIKVNKSNQLPDNS
jgi:hypothetical protein